MHDSTESLAAEVAGGCAELTAKLDEEKGLADERVKAHLDLVCKMLAYVRHLEQQLAKAEEVRAKRRKYKDGADVELLTAIACAERKMQFRPQQKQGRRVFAWDT